MPSPPPSPNKHTTKNKQTGSWMAAAIEPEGMVSVCPFGPAVGATAGLLL